VFFRSETEVERNVRTILALFLTFTLFVAMTAVGLALWFGVSFPWYGWAAGLLLFPVAFVLIVNLSMRIYLAGKRSPSDHYLPRRSTPPQTPAPQTHNEDYDQPVYRPIAR
jgi:membrane protein implicated in regulation of membrane protease activity